MRAAALSALLLLAVPSALGVNMPSTCGTGSTGALSCYNGTLFQMADGTFVPGTNATLPVSSYGANTACIVWSFHCTPQMAAVVAMATLVSPLVVQALPCTQQTINLTATVGAFLCVRISLPSQRFCRRPLTLTHALPLLRPRSHRHGRHLLQKRAAHGDCAGSVPGQLAGVHRQQLQHADGVGRLRREARSARCCGDPGSAGRVLRHKGASLRTLGRCYAIVSFYVASCGVSAARLDARAPACRQ